MEFKKYLTESLKSNIGFVTRTLGDFTDDDMFQRPCPGANHAAWQLGHITSAEAGSVKTLAPEKGIALPAGFTDIYSKKTAVNDDSAQFAPFNTKAQLIELYTQVRHGTIAWIESLNADQLDHPTPEKFASWAPTYGLLAALQVGHTMMHVGQFQVIRRKLGKPLLF